MTRTAGGVDSVERQPRVAPSQDSTTEHAENTDPGNAASSWLDPSLMPPRPLRPLRWSIGTAVEPQPLLAPSQDSTTARREHRSGQRRVELAGSQPHASAPSASPAVEYWDSCRATATCRAIPRFHHSTQRTQIRATPRRAGWTPAPCLRALCVPCGGVLGQLSSDSHVSRRLLTIALSAYSLFPCGPPAPSAEVLGF